jgi:hypothetical protein
MLTTQTGTPYYCRYCFHLVLKFGTKILMITNVIFGLLVACYFLKRIYELAALKPPFRANDMKGLYRKIQKGVYEPIPPMYSADLSIMIQTLLKVIYSCRPTQN